MPELRRMATRLLLFVLLFLGEIIADRAGVVLLFDLYDDRSVFMYILINDLVHRSRTFETLLVIGDLFLYERDRIVVSDVLL